MKEKLEIYYSLGYFYCALGEYMEAAKYLRLSHNFGFAPLTSTFYLGYAYLRNREYDAAIKEFCELEKRMQEELGQPQKIVEREAVEHIPLGEMSALAYWGRAFAYESKLQQTSDATEKRQLLTRIRACCLHARELDTNDHSHSQVDDLLGRLAPDSVGSESKIPP